MLPFSFGVASVVGAIGFPIVYLIFRQFRHVEAWANRAQRPKERVGVFIVVFVVIGIVAGSMAQPVVDIGASCLQRGKPLIPCLFFMQ